MQASEPEAEREPAGRARRRFRGRAPLAAAATVVAVLLVALAPAATAGTPSAPQAPTPPDIVWEATSAPDLLGAFQRTEYNEESGAPEVVPSPTTGRPALQFTVPGGGTRSELLPKVGQQQNGDNLFFGYSGKLADDFPVDADSYQILMQWHHASDEGSPPVAVHVKRGQLVLAGGGNNDHEPFEVPIGAARPGMDLNLVVRVFFSKKPEEGSVDVWSGGRHVITDFKPPSGTAYDQYNYLKVGLYRDPSLEGTARVLVNNVVVGTDLPGVQQEVGAPSAESGDGGEGTTADPDAISSSRESTWSASSFALGAAVVVAIGLGIAVARRSRGRPGR